MDVYYNLHKHMLSIRSRESVDYGIVIGHASMVMLKNCKFVVNNAGRKRVLKEKKKNVHAFVRGETHTDVFKHDKKSGRLIIYNPYKYSSFVFKDTEEPVTRADYVTILQKEIVAYNPT